MRFESFSDWSFSCSQRTNDSIPSVGSLMIVKISFKTETYLVIKAFLRLFPLWDLTCALIIFLKTEGFLAFRAQIRIFLVWVSHVQGDWFTDWSVSEIQSTDNVFPQCGRHISQAVSYPWVGYYSTWSHLAGCFWCSFHGWVNARTFYFTRSSNRQRLWLQ